MSVYHLRRLRLQARAVLREVEPRHAEYERRTMRDPEIVHVPRVVDGALAWVAMLKSDWRPRATRTPSGWSIASGWLDEAVPELLTGRTVPQERPRWTAERAEIARAKGEGRCDAAHELTLSTRARDAAARGCVAITTARAGAAA